jgi:hypothetical protein
VLTVEYAGREAVTAAGGGRPVAPDRGKAARSLKTVAERRTPFNPAAAPPTNPASKPAPRAACTPAAPRPPPPTVTTTRVIGSFGPMPCASSVSTYAEGC